MIEIKHKLTGEVLHVVQVDTMKKANLTRANLSFADLTDADLRGACLRYADLSEAELSGASLSYADLDYADLGETDLSHANLNYARLIGARLTGADLRYADLTEANLDCAGLLDANLRHAILRHANLNLVDLSLAALSHADLNSAILDSTKFLECDDLHLAKGLESVEHYGPCSLDARTLRASIEHLPDVFLRGVGYTDHEIGYLRALYRDKVIQYYSCFISYSHKDEDFAKRLHSRLVQENIRVWYAPEDMRSGQKLHEQIDEAIRLHDRLLLVLSPESMNSEWVMTEIRKARKAEVRDKKRKLFPISITDWHKVKEWECFDADNGKDLGVEVREYYVPDFSTWKDHDAFETEFQKLLKSFQADAKNN